MSGPKEGSRETDEGIIISEAMDWCNSPTDPVPYRIWAKQVQCSELANSVRISNDRTHVKKSIILQCYGDEPGCGGGVLSGTNEAECTPLTWAPTVRAEDRNIVRHTDFWFMNHKNTYGKMYFEKDMTVYPSVDQERVERNLYVNRLGMENNTVGSENADQFKALSPDLAEGGSAGLEGAKDVPASGLLEHQDPIEARRRNGSASPTIKRRPSRPRDGAWWAAIDIALDAWVRSTATYYQKKCCIAPYNINAPPNPVHPDQGGLGFCAKCKAGQRTEAHHGYVDYPFRTGGPWDSKHRALGAPSYAEALTICVSSKDKDDGGGDVNHHRNIHQSFERSMNGYRKNSTDGTVTFSQVQSASEKAIMDLPESVIDDECKTLYQIELRHQYRLSGDELLRASDKSPSPQNDTDTALFDKLKQDWKQP